MHRHVCTPRGVGHCINVGDVVTVHDENLPRGLWRLGRVEELINGANGKVRSVVVRIPSKGANSKVIKRPIQRLYPLEFSSEESSNPASGIQDEFPTSGDSSPTISPQGRDVTESTQGNKRPRRQAYLRA